MTTAEEESSMSNPRDTMSDPSEATQAAPHPVSQHRTPREIAADEAGPIGKPDLDVGSGADSPDEGQLESLHWDRS